MLAQATMGPSDQVETAIRAYVGRFISGRAIIAKQQNSPNLQVQAEANRLMPIQLSLETDLEKATAMIANIKAGAYTMGDLLWLGNFSRQLAIQVKAVDKIAKGTKPAGGMNTNTLLFLGVTSVIGLGMMYFRKKGKI